MRPKVFLSLSYVDDTFVDQVYRRLPLGLAFFYKKSFENGASLISEMERGVSEAQIFVLFASRPALESRGVQFELERAQQQSLSDSKHRVLVYPTNPSISHEDLPSWLKPFWVPNSGYSPSDIARHISQLLIEEFRSEIFGSEQIIGRGKSSDELSAQIAEHIARHNCSPKVVFLSGFRGIGRRTFAKYFCRTALTYIGNAPYGPTITLPDQSDITDLYFSIRTEISDRGTQEQFERDLAAFNALKLNEKATEISRNLRHFSGLSQIPIIVSASGFFEDSGQPKSWLFPVFEALESDSFVFL